MKIRLLIILILALWPAFVWSQDIRSVTGAAIKKLDKVKEALNRMDWISARDLSEKLCNQYPEWPESWKAMAEACQGTGDIGNSENALRKLVGLDSVHYTDAFRWIAEWTFNRGDYRDAGHFFDKYFLHLKDTSALSFPLKHLRLSIRFSLRETARTGVTFPTRLAGPVNTTDDEYFPSLSVDGSMLAFTRQARLHAGGKLPPPQEDLFYVPYRDSGYYDPHAFPFPINTPGNEGTQSLTQDGRIMFLTCCNRPDTKGGCDIYYCVKSGDRWSDPLNLGYPVNSRYWESTPFLAQDGKRLFFASNRPGGLGGMDIWESVLDAGKGWSAPVNLGPGVNTPYDEMSPALLVDGKTLFFASTGHPGLGGFDLFMTDLSAKGKREPVNLGIGINTRFNEDCITINAGRNLGLLASDRDSTNGKDIYQVDLSGFIPHNATFMLSGTVKDRLTGLPLGARIEIQPHGDSVTSSVEADPVTGSFLLGIPERPSYRIGASSPGYLPHSQYYLNDTAANVSLVHYEIVMEPVRIGAGIILRNIFFAFNSSELLPASGKDLDEVLTVFRQNPGIVIEISGYTDNIGTEAYNLTLSQKRAESVMNFLISRGISPLRISARGYGRSNPLATNDTEEGRSQNRRTEMKVIRLKQP